MKYLLCLLLSFNAFADCNEKVTPIEKGEVAQCGGFIFNDQAEKEASQAKHDVDFYKEVNTELTQKSEAQDKDINILERRLNLYVEQSNTLADSVAKKDNSEGLIRIGYFALGAVLTGIIAANVKR